MVTSDTSLQQLILGQPKELEGIAQRALGKWSPEIEGEEATHVSEAVQMP